MRQTVQRESRNKKHLSRRHPSPDYWLACLPKQLLANDTLREHHPSKWALCPLRRITWLSFSAPTFYPITLFHSTRVLTIQRTVNKDHREFDHMLQCLLPWPTNALITNQLNGSLICQDKQTYPIAQPSGCRLGLPDAWFSPDPFCGIWFLLSLLVPEQIPWMQERKQNSGFRGKTQN